MPPTTSTHSYLCARCLRTNLDVARASRRLPSPRSLSTSRPSQVSSSPELQDGTKTSSSSHSGNVGADSDNKTRQPGAMTHRLQHLSEADLSGTRAEDIEAAGFNDELRDQLLGRINDANAARRLNQQAFSVSEIPSSAGRHARDLAAAPAWSGTESVADASLRMLNDAHKPLKVPARSASPARVPRKVDTGRPPPKTAGARGTRLANARDRSSTYAYLKDSSISQEERDKVQKQLKERFGSSARTMPATVQGLASLANERIENAIARGQFRNLPDRGKKIERDYNAGNPFIDTTEYLMNKMIQRQDIVPPWIEKQQELVGAATRFRARLRNDWRRHAARSIASGGGTLDDQIARAEAYAAAEMAVNPPRRKSEVVNTVDDEGHLSQISLSGELRVPADGSEPSMETTVEVEDARELEEAVRELAAAVDANTATAGTASTDADADAAATEPPSDTAATEDPVSAAAAVTPVVDPDPTPTPPGPVFRDPTWQATEQGYHATAVADLNALTRSYNLMAPDLAKKPYFALDRELRACFGDVAPSLAAEIRERALGPRARARDAAAADGTGLVDTLLGAGGGHVAQVRDEVPEKAYGFRQFWRDVFGAGGRA